jgi:hypothetical protein
MGKGLSLLSSLVILPLLGGPALAQVYGHEYEENAAPIREGEQPVVPLDTQDPSFNAWRTPLPSYEGLRKIANPELSIRSASLAKAICNSRRSCINRWLSPLKILLPVKLTSRSWARSLTWAAVPAVRPAGPMRSELVHLPWVRRTSTAHACDGRSTPGHDGWRLRKRTE